MINKKNLSHPVWHMEDPQQIAAIVVVLSPPSRNEAGSQEI